MLERFTGEAREAVVRAQGHARRLGHGWTGCEHFLLAVAESATPAGVVCRDRGFHPEAVQQAIDAVIGTGHGRGNSDDKAVLAKLGIDLDEVRDAVQATFGPAALELLGTPGRRRMWHRVRRRQTTCATATGRPPLTPKAKRCLELALLEALRLRHDHVGVEHIALALLRGDDTAAWNVLLRLGGAPYELRRVIEEQHRHTG